MLGLSKLKISSKTNPIWQPNHVSGLALWLKNGTGITGNPASQWDDQSGNGNNVAQGTGAYQATVTDGGLTFDGDDDSYSFTQISNSANHNIVVGVVFAVDAFSAAMNFLSDDNNEFFQLQTNKKVRVKMGGTTTLCTCTGATLFDPTNGIQSLVITRLDGATGTWKFYRNNVDMEALAGFSSITNQANPNQIDFDIFGGAVSNGYFNGTIYEIVVYDLGTAAMNSFDEGDLSNLNSYLLSNFNIAT